jgi:hypothetical protein
MSAVPISEENRYSFSASGGTSTLSRDALKVEGGGGPGGGGAPAIPFASANPRKIVPLTEGGGSTSLVAYSISEVFVMDFSSSFSSHQSGLKLKFPGAGSDSSFSVSFSQNVVLSDNDVALFAFFDYHDHIGKSAGVSSPPRNALGVVLVEGSPKLKALQGDHKGGLPPRFLRLHFDADEGFKVFKRMDATTWMSEKMVVVNTPGVDVRINQMGWAASADICTLVQRSFITIKAPTLILHPQPKPQAPSHAPPPPPSDSGWETSRPAAAWQNARQPAATMPSATAPSLAPAKAAPPPKDTSQTQGLLEEVAGLKAALVVSEKERQRLSTYIGLCRISNPPPFRMPFAGGGGHPSSDSVLSRCFKALLPMFTTKEATTLRQVCREFKSTVEDFPWEDKDTVIRGSVAAWRACFPRARWANVMQRYDGGRVTPVVDSDFVHFVGLRGLNMRFCGSITDAAFVHLKGIHTLNMHYCDQATITDAAFVHLKGIHTLNMAGCRQPTITDAAFTHLKGIHSLNMAGCKQATIQMQHLPT